MPAERKGSCRRVQAVWTSCNTEPVATGGPKLPEDSSREMFHTRPRHPPSCALALRGWIGSQGPEPSAPPPPKSPAVRSASHISSPESKAAGSSRPQARSQAKCAKGERRHCAARLSAHIVKSIMFRSGTRVEDPNPRNCITT